MASQVRVALVLCFVLVLAGAALAQNRPQSPQVAREPFRGSGKVRGMSQGILYVVGQTGEQWVVKVDARPGDVTYRGTARPSFLRPGMYVRFSCLLDGRHHAQSPIAAIEVFVPGEKTHLGVFPDTGDEASKAGEAAGAGGKLHKGGPPAKKTGEPKKGEPSERKGAAKAAAGTGRSSRVVGTVQSLKGATLTVAAAGTEVVGQLDPHATITVETPTFHFVRPGDGVELQGSRLVARPAFVVANRVTITGAEPLGSEKPEPVRRERAKSEKAKGP